MSQLSKITHSRNQWKAKAKQRSDHHRYLRKQLARVKAERDQAKQDLKATHSRLRQLESQTQAVAVRPKVDVVWLCLQLFLVVRISFRAVCRVLTLLGPELGMQKAPCPQTVISHSAPFFTALKQFWKSFQRRGRTSYARLISWPQPLVSLYNFS